MIFVLCGIVIGSFAADRCNAASDLLIGQRMLTEGGAWHTFIGTFMSIGVFLLAAFAAGLSVFGAPCGLALLVLRGIGIGASVASMYLVYGKGAVLPVLVTVLPRSAAAAFIAVISVREAVRNSGALLAFCLDTETRGERQISFRLYCIRFVVLILFSIFISAADGAIVHFYASLHK